MKHNFLLMSVLIFSISVIPFSVQYSIADTGVISVDSVDVNYDIDNGNVESILLDPDLLELIIVINTQADGTIKVTIPRDILDAKFELSDDLFFVLVDGFETDYSESESDLHSRTLSIPFFNGDSVIEIVGTQALTQFIPSPEIKIPDWIKNNAGWWADDLIEDADFVSGIQYLITTGIIRV